MFKTGALFSNLVFRGILYVLIAGPCFLLAPQILGGLFSLLTGITYFVAAYHGERWEKEQPKGRRS
jgi:hypothetical protein